MKPDATKGRKDWLSILSKAPEGAVRAGLDGLGPIPDHRLLRAPEIGSVMVQGRAGGTGAAFNLGEMTVTRCSLRLATGEVGHGYVQGRRKDCAQAAALADALMQTALAADVQAKVLDPIAATLAVSRHDRAAKAAATRVEFFTLVRGED